MRTAPGFLVSSALIMVIGGALMSPPRPPVAPTSCPSDESEAVLHVTTTIALDRSRGSVTVRGDGDGVIQPGLGPGRASPEPLVLRVGQDGVRRTLRAAASAGLLDHPDFGSPRRAGAGAVRIEIHTDRHRRVVSVPAGLDPAGDRGLTARQRRARPALRRFVHQVLDPSFYRPAHEA